MENNLFKSLEQYRTTDKKHQTEDYFTASFRFILEYHKDIRKEFVQLLFSKKRRGLSSFGSKKLNIEAQSVYSNSIIDLEISNPHGDKIFIENKIESPMGYSGEKPNVIKYCQLPQSTWVAYITLNDEVIDDQIKKEKKFLGHYLWRDIYPIIKRYSKRDLLIEHFVKYMEVLDMNDIKKLELSDLNSWSKYYDLERALRNYVVLLQEKYDKTGWVDDYNPEPPKNFCITLRNPARNRSLWKNRGIVLYAGFYCDNKEDKEYGYRKVGIIYVELQINKDWFVKKLLADKSINEMLKKLRKKKFNVISKRWLFITKSLPITELAKKITKKSQEKYIMGFIGKNVAILKESIIKRIDALL